MNRIQECIQSLGRPAVLAMIHVRALPGTPSNSMNLKEITNLAVSEAEIYRRAGVDGLIVENMHDLPYLQREEVGPEIIASMTRVCLAVRQVFGNFTGQKPLFGVQILAGANTQALAVAQAVDYDFIRVEGFVYAHVADEGLLNACAGRLLRYRKAIGAANICILADIEKKHCSHAITADLTLGDRAQAAELFQANGLVITGKSTGREPNSAHLNEVLQSSNLPVFVGSGLTEGNFRKFSAASGFIVGSHFKKNGKWFEEIDEAKARCFVNAVNTESKGR